MPHLKLAVLRPICGLLAAAALAGTASAALSQTTVGELVVIGHESRTDPETLSFRVSYRDLDLRGEPGRQELDRRIRVTAKHVCARLGEIEHVSGNNAACEQMAIQDARSAANEAKIRAFRSTRHWKPGPPWSPPGA